MREELLLPSSLFPAKKRLTIELGERESARRGSRTKAGAQAQWNNLPDILEKNRLEGRYARWKDMRVSKGQSTISLTTEQALDVLALLDHRCFPADGEYVLIGGAKLKIEDRGDRCALVGYHYDGDDLQNVIRRIRNGDSVRTV